MTPENSKPELEERIKQSGAAINTLTPSKGVRLMLDLYKAIRAENCELDDDGDMLLFQWGTYDWGKGPSFQFDITRQFTVSHSEEDEEEYEEEYDEEFEEDAAVFQLSLKFHFVASTEFDALKSGNHWCRTPAELPGFEAIIFDSDAYRAVQASRPSKVTVDYGVAG